MHTRTLVWDAAAANRPSVATEVKRGPESSAPQLTLPWLVRLRWAAVATQLVLIALGLWAGWLGSAWPLLALVALTAASNATIGGALHLDRIGESRQLLGGVLILDVCVLTGLLLASGGPSNPFSVAYLVYVTLAAVTLGEGWAWLVVGSAVAGYASLFIWHAPLPEQALHAGGVTSHLAGMWLAFAASATLIAFFVTRVARTLVHREREIADLRQLAARHERLAALITLAAGAAHELATPLASIAVAARELEREAAAAGPALQDDARLIRAQVERCRVILDQMSGRASREWLERPSRVSLDEVLALVRDALGDRAARLRVEGRTDTPLLISRAGLAQALLNLIRNAFDASPDGADVVLRIDTTGERVALAVTDAGAGISPEHLDHLGEPFYTTKAPGTGYGLGLFLVRLFAEHHRGRLAIESTLGEGTNVVLELPREAMV